MVKRTKKSAKPFMARQGDVLVMEINLKPSGDWVAVPREEGGVILARGEVTGHKHQIRDPGVCMLRAEGISDTVITCATSSELVHEEHGMISLKKGTYRVRIQREWGGEISRRVED